MRLRKLFNKETIIESVGIVAVFTMLQRIIQIGRGIIFARLLGPREYGAYTLAFFFVPLVVSLVKLGIPSSFSRYIPQYEKRRELVDFLKKTYFPIIVLSVFIGLGCFLSSTWLSRIIYNSPVYYRLVIIASFAILPHAVFEAIEATFSGLRVFKLSSILKFSQFIVFTALAIVLVFFSPKAESVILANLVSLIVVTALFVFLLKRYLFRLDSQESKIHETDFYKKIFKFSIWFIMAPVVYTLFVYTDRWMLTHLMGLSHAGIYSVATNISGMVFMFGMIIGSVLMPNLSEVWESGRKDKAIEMLNSGTKANVLVLLTGAAILYIFRMPIIFFLYGEAYIKCVPIVGFLLIFWLFNSIRWTVGNYAHLIEKTHIRFICSLVGLVSNVFLNYILIPKYGILGASVATASSSVIMTLTMLLWFWMEGLNIKPGTLLVCILPFIFLLNNPFIVTLSLILLIGLILKTGLILTKNEKEFLGNRLKGAISKRNKGVIEICQR